MGFIELVLIARTQYVDKIMMPHQSEWHMKIKCTHCNTQFPKIITVDQSHEEEMSKQHGVANFIAKCKNCDHRGSIRIDPKSPYEVKPNQDGIIKQPLCLFQCRGIDILQVQLGQFLSVQGKNSQIIFKNVDLTDVWCQYDQSTTNVVQVEDAKYQLRYPK